LRLFYVDPSVPSGKPRENIIQVKKTETLQEATLIAWQVYCIVIILKTSLLIFSFIGFIFSFFH